MIPDSPLRLFGQTSRVPGLALALAAWAFAQLPADTSNSPTPERPQVSRDSSQAALKYGAIGIGSVVVGSAVYGLVLSDGWWSESSGGFHWEKPSNDFHYAHNLDKAGHFYSGLWIGEAFHDAYSWAGMGEQASYVTAGLTAGAVHLGMEMKDGLSPDWGFSVWDVASGSLGGFYPMAQRYLPVPFGFVDIKESYWQNSRAYLDSPVQPNAHVWFDDYVNETFWASVKIHKALPEKIQPYWQSPFG